MSSMRDTSSRHAWSLPVSDGAKLYPAHPKAQVMADPLMLADGRATRFTRADDGAVELIGRSQAVLRVQELIRRGAALNGGALITAEAGAGVEGVARELHS